MRTASLSQKRDQLQVPRGLERQWRRLTDRYLPIGSAKSKWKYSRSLTTQDPDQGWKLHITATILTANKTLSKVGPLLKRRGVLFKAPASLQVLSRLNSGIHSEFSQVGKFITVYPRSSDEAVLIAEKLDQLVSPLSGPAIPFDIRLHETSSIFYRYGSFNPHKGKGAIGSQSAIRNPTGRLIRDRRGPGAAIPDWLDDPFSKLRGKKRKRIASNPLKTDILAYELISQRGKGGVYKAIDISVMPMRICVLKEGRKHGETDWDDHDGAWRLKNEKRVLSSLSASSVRVPKIYRAFELEHNFYLAMEYVEGRSLETFLARKRKMALFDAIHFGFKLAKLLSQIHNAGWVWRDCKPTNLIVTKSGTLVPIDFEGACRVNRSAYISWGTPGYVPNDRLTSGRLNRVPDDLYALGVVLHRLFSGHVPNFPPSGVPSIKLGRGVPRPVTIMISDLLNPDPALRPSASTVSRTLKRLINSR